MYAIWTPVLGGDSRSRWDGSIFDDPRAVNLWDQDRVAGKWFAKAYSLEPLAWDVYFLYSPRSHWGARPSHLLRSGGPVIELDPKVLEHEHLLGR